MSQLTEGAKMVAIWQIQISNALSWMKMIRSITFMKIIRYILLQYTNDKHDWIHAKFA